MVLFATVVVITSAQVIARYVFNNSFVWAEELARYVFIWATMIATGLGFRQGSHLTLSLLTDRLKPKANLFVLLLGEIVIVVFLFTLIIYGMKIVSMNFTITSAAMKIPLAIPYLGIPFGGAIILIFNLEMVIKKISSLLKEIR